MNYTDSPVFSTEVVHVSQEIRSDFLKAGALRVYVWALICQVTGEPVERVEPMVLVVSQESGFIWVICLSGTNHEKQGI